MWVKIYKKALIKSIKYYLKEGYDSQEIWAILNGLLPFLCDNFEKETEETEKYKDLLNEISLYNPIREECEMNPENYYDDKKLSRILSEFVTR